MDGQTLVADSASPVKLWMVFREGVAMSHVNNVKLNEWSTMPAMKAIR